jgi:hypothetical protein
MFLSVTILCPISFLSLCSESSILLQRSPRERKPKKEIKIWWYCRPARHNPLARWVSINQADAPRGRGGPYPCKTSADAKTWGAFIPPHYLPAWNLLILLPSVSGVYTAFRILKHCSFSCMNEVEAYGGSRVYRSVCPHVSSLNPLDGFCWNLVLWVYSKRCWLHFVFIPMA